MAEILPLPPLLIQGLEQSVGGGPYGHTPSQVERWGGVSEVGCHRA